MIVTVEPAQKGDLEGLVDRSIYSNYPAAKQMFYNHVKMSSDVWVGKADGVVACAFGVIAPSIISEQAYIWVITTGIVEEHKFTFIRYSQRVLETLLEQYESIVGFCFVQETSAIRWLKFLGAVFDETPQEDRLPFKIRRRR